MASTALDRSASLDTLAVQAQIDEALVAGDADTCADLILKLLGHEALYPARSAADRCARRFPDDVRLERIKRLTAPPRIVPSPNIERIPRRADFDWLKEHAVEYPGEWLVLSRGKLWGHAATLDAAQEQANEAGLAERPLLYHAYQDS